MIPNLEYYRAFLAAATLGSATKAAESLHLTQSGVSQSIRKLEESLDATLFSRSRSGLKLTLEGEVLFRHVQKAFDELSVGESKAQRVAEHNRTTLTIGATETSIRYFMLPALERFHIEEPHIALSLRGTTTPALCSALSSGEIEAALLFSPLTTEEGFRLIPLGEVQDIPVASMNYPADPHTLAELAEFPVISVTKANGVRALLDKWFLSEGIILTPAVTVVSMGLVLPLVRQGLGIGIVPDVMAKYDLAAGTLKQLSVEHLPEKRILYFATSSKYPTSRPCSLFLKFMQEHLYH